MNVDHFGRVTGLLLNLVKRGVVGGTFGGRTDV